MEASGEIALRHGVKNFVPGETISGELVWLSEGAVELRLFWFTEGRGTRDVEVVERQPFPAKTLKGAFSFTLPAVPYSFSGSLVAVKWVLELVDEKEDVLASEEIVVSPTATEIVLPVVESLRTQKKISRARRR